MEFEFLLGIFSFLTSKMSIMQKEKSTIISFITQIHAHQKCQLTVAGTNVQCPPKGEAQPLTGNVLLPTHPNPARDGRSKVRSVTLPGQKTHPAKVTARVRV